MKNTLRILSLSLMLVIMNFAFSQQNLSNLKYLLSEGYTLAELEDLLLNMPRKKPEKWMKNKGYEFREEVPSKNCYVFKKGEVVSLYAFYFENDINEIRIQSSPQKYYQAVSVLKESGKYKQVVKLNKKNMTMKAGYSYWRKDNFIFYTYEEDAIVGVIFNYPLNMKQQFKSNYIPEMVMVNGGEFIMGTDDENAPEKIKPAWDAEVTDFQIGKYEITVKEYLYFCQMTNRIYPEKPTYGFIDNYPIVNVSWYDANDYCDWLSYVTGKTYRLPYEAEWEFAAKGGKKSKGFKYAGSDFLEKVGWLYPKGKVTIKRCGSTYPNELGLYDMSANVWEWCADWFDKEYYGNRKKSDKNLLFHINPKGPFTGTSKILRGGGGEEAPRSIVQNRLGDLPVKSYSDSGFRIVLVGK